MPLSERDFLLLDLISIKDGAMIIPSVTRDPDLDTIVSLNPEGELVGMGIAVVWLALARMAGSNDKDVYGDYANEALAYLKNRFWPTEVREI